MNPTGYRPRNRRDPALKNLSRREEHRAYYLKRKLEKARQAEAARLAAIPRRQVILSIPAPLRGSIAWGMPISTRPIVEAA